MRLPWHGSGADDASRRTPPTPPRPAAPEPPRSAPPEANSVSLVRFPTPDGLPVRAFVLIIRSELPRVIIEIRVVFDVTVIGFLLFRFISVATRCGAALHISLALDPILRDLRVRQSLNGGRVR